MTLVSAADRRSFVRDTATQIAAAASVTLNPETAAGLETICVRLHGTAQKVGAVVISEFAYECGELCGIVAKGISPNLCAEADELMKASFAAIQSSLFSMALGGVQDAPHGHFDRLSSRILQMTAEEDPHGVKAVKTDPNPIKLDDLDGLAESFFSPAVPVPAAPRVIRAEISPDKEPAMSATDAPFSPPEPAPVTAVAPEPMPVKATAPAPVPEASADEDWEELSRMTAESFEPAAGTVSAGRDGAVEKLLRLIASLTERIQQNTDYRELALGVAQAAKTVHSLRFEQVCNMAKTDTPDALLEEGQATAIREQLGAWLQDAPPAQPATASLRQVGGVLWLELRQPQSGGEAPGAASPRVARTPGTIPGVLLNEEYALPDGTSIRRARLELLLPAFQAHEVTFAGRIFLFPAGDIQPANGGAAGAGDAVPLGRLLDLPAQWHPQSPLGATFLLRFRGISVPVTTESVTEARTYLARNVYDAGPELRGVMGIARLADGRKAAVVDPYPWLETYAERLREQEKDDPRSEATPGRYVVFRAAGRRYAVPLGCVRGVGRLDGESFLIGMVETDRGAFYLRDIKDALGLEGEAGGVYVAIASDHGTIAWVVDGVERVQVYTPGAKPSDATEPRQAAFGFRAGARKGSNAIRGVLPLATEAGKGGSTPAAPVYLLDPAQLIPSARGTSKARRAA